MLSAATAKGLYALALTLSILGPLVVPTAPALPPVALTVCVYLAYLLLVVGIAPLALPLGWVAVVALLLGLGLAAPTLMARLGGSRYLSRDVAAGAVIGSLIGLFLDPSGTLLGMMVGFILGAVVVQARGGRSPGDALREGVAALWNLSGPRGAAFILALTAASIAYRMLP